jgi:hypothetical protein
MSAGGHDERLDRPATPHPDRNAFSPAERPDRSILRNAGARFLWAGGKLAGAWLDAPDSHLYQKVRPSNVETLVGGTLDFATPPVFATDELLPALPNGHQVVVSEVGHTGDFWGIQKSAGTHLVATFLDDGTVDTSRYRHQPVDFTPSTAQSSIAKIVLVVMLGFALAMMLWLVTLAVRVRRQGGTGPMTGAWIRSVGPIVFGLGGFFVGVLVVLTLWPSVPLDNQLLAVASTGVPIGAGVYAGWVRRDTPTAMHAKGIRNAALGALVGAWLGFHATSGLVALVTTIAGAAAAANLGLLVLDIWTERAARSRTAAPVDGASVVTARASTADDLAPATR